MKIQTYIYNAKYKTLKILKRKKLNDNNTFIKQTQIKEEIKNTNIVRLKKEAIVNIIHLQQCFILQIFFHK